MADERRDDEHDLSHPADDPEPRGAGEDAADADADAQDVTIEIAGLSVLSSIGVSEAEREVGRRLTIDVRLEVPDCAATATDDVADTIDYAEVCHAVALVANQRPYATLERLAAAIADRLVAEFGAAGVWLKVGKPDPPLALAVDEAAVELWREAR